MKERPEGGQLFLISNRLKKSKSKAQYQSSVFSKHVCRNDQTYGITRTPAHLGHPWKSESSGNTIVQETMLPLKASSPQKPGALK